MERDILHLTIPFFPIALQRVVDPSLHGRPVAIAPSTSDRALVACASTEAREDGVFEGMPIFRARRFCPSLRILPPDPRLVSRGTAAILELTGRYTPLWEPSCAGSLYLDMTGSRRLLGPGRDAAARLDRDVVSRLRLKGTVGVAGNKMVSRIASGCLNRPGVCDVLRGSEGTFIAPMHVSVLPGVGRAREQTLLAELNLRRVSEVAALSVAHLSLAFGPFAHLLHWRSRGVDPSPVLPPRRVPDVAEESYLACEDNHDPLLLAELFRLAEGCGLSLRRLGKAAGSLSLTVRHTDGADETRAAALPSPLDTDVSLFGAASALFFEACRRRVRVRGMRLSCGRLHERGGQMDLFASQAAPAKAAALQDALDRVRERYGNEAVRWGRTVEQTCVERI